MTVWNEVIDKHCPPKRSRVSKPHCPWLAENSELQQLMSERDDARDAWLCLRTPESRSDFTRLRNLVKGQVISARRSLLCGELEAGARQGFWPTFRRFLLTDKTQERGAPQESVIEAETVADNLNRYFAFVGPSIADELREHAGSGMEQSRPPTVCSARLSLRPVTLPELSVCVRRMRIT